MSAFLRLSFRLRLHLLFQTILTPFLIEPCQLPASPRLWPADVAKLAVSTIIAASLAHEGARLASTQVVPLRPNGTQLCEALVRKIDLGGLRRVILIGNLICDR